MIKELRKEAKGILKNNYKSIIIPTVVSVGLAEINYAVFNYLMSFSYWGRIALEWRVFIFCLLLFSEFALVPIANACIFKASVNTVMGSQEQNRSTIRDFIKRNYFKIVLINILPCLLDLFYRWSTESSGSIYALDVNTSVRIAVQIVLFFVRYKLFACNYLLSVNDTLSVKETLSGSFKIMRKRFFRYILLTLSLWYLDILFVAVFIFVYFILLGTPAIRYFGLLGPIACGFNFYLIPYRYLIYTLYFDNTRRTN